MKGSQNRQSQDRRQVTVLFADISGFTALSELMDPEELAASVDACFRGIERIVVARAGTVDKFMGDCVMALFGAPQAVEDSPRQAINAAIAIRNELVRFNGEHRLPAMLDVHIGVNTGLVVAGDIGGEVKRDYTVMGSTVNLASRLESVASGGQILVGPTTYRYARHEFEFRRLKPQKVKGFSQAVVSYEVVSQQESVYRGLRDKVHEEFSSRLVGRQREFATLEKGITRLVGGEGSIITVIGENGMGKSRLIAEVEASEVGSRVRFLEARSRSVGGSLSFHPFIDLLTGWAGLGPHANHVDTAKAMRRSIATAYGDEHGGVFAVVAKMMGLELDDVEAQFLEGVSGEALERLTHKTLTLLFEKIAKQNPVALVFEDLHWADQSSMSLLARLVHLVETQPVLFILVFRPDYENTGDRVLRYVAEHLPLYHQSVRVGSLGDHDCDALIDNLLNTDDLPLTTRMLIKRNTEGNPFYVEEVLRSLMEQGALVRDRHGFRATKRIDYVEIPATIEEVIMARVDRLNEPLRRVLQVASVVGRTFERRVLERVLPGELDLDHGLAGLVDKRFLDPGMSRHTTSRGRSLLSAETEYRFKHALIQESVYRALLNRTRRRLHAECAAAIESLFSDRIQDAYGMLANHYARAEQLDKAEEYLVKAGEDAANSAASAEALQYFREAYNVYLRLHGDKADKAEKAKLEGNIAQALLNTGNLVESIEHYNAALRSYGQRVPRSTAGLWLKLGVDLSAVFFRSYRGARMRIADREPATAHDVVACFYGRSRAQNPTDPQRNFFDNIAAIRYLGHVDASTVERACGMYAATGAFFAFAGLSFAIGRRFLGIAAELMHDDKPVDRIQYGSMASVLDFHVGNWSGERDMDDGLLEKGMRMGLLWDADIYLGMVCERNIRQGRFAEAAHMIDKLAELRRVFGYDFAESNEYAMRAFLLLEKRDLQSARVAMEAYYDARHEDPMRLLALSGLVKIATLQGRLDAAEDALAKGERILARADHMVPFYLGSYHTSRLFFDVTRLALHPGRPATRKAVRSAKAALRTATKIARERPEALRLAARVQWLRGARQQAFEIWRKSIGEAEHLDARPELGRAFADIGECLASAEAETLTFDSLDTDGCLSRAGDLLEPLGLGTSIGSLRELGRRQAATSTVV